jgi:hypothetical protein
MTTETLPAAVAVRTSDLRYWLKVFACILAVKGVIFAVDHVPMFFLGDSVAYFFTATGQWIPPDRSFVYGWLVRFFGLRTGTLTMLLASQAVASAACAGLAAFVVRRYFGASRRVAAVVGVLCAIEPLQLLYERYMMTEAFSLLTFAIFTIAALDYLKRPSVLGMVLLQVAGIVVVSLRVSFLPCVMTASVLVPVLVPVLGMGMGMGMRRPEIRVWGRIGLHLGVSLVMFWALHTAYKHWYAELIRPQLPNAGPAYYYDNGFHLLCFVAPLVQEVDFPDPEKAPEVFRDLAFDLRDPDKRALHRWWEGGLIDHVKLAYEDPLEANRAAERTAKNAVWRDPVGEFRLARRSFADYWNLEKLRRGMVTDRGSDRELPPELLELLDMHFHVKGEMLPHLTTVTNWYYFRAWPWYLALLLLPIPGLVAIGICRRESRPAAMLLFVFVGLHIAVIAGCSIVPTVRFLHAVAWLGLITAGIFMSRAEGLGKDAGASNLDPQV